MNKTILKHIQDDIAFLVSFAPARRPEDVEEGLAPMFYLTGTYEGDVQLAEKVQAICDRYDVAEQPEEEDYAETE